MRSTNLRAMSIHRFNRIFFCSCFHRRFYLFDTNIILTKDIKATAAVAAAINKTNKCKLPKIWSIFGALKNRLNLLE